MKLVVFSTSGTPLQVSISDIYTCIPIAPLLVATHANDKDNDNERCFVDRSPALPTFRSQTKFLQHQHQGHWREHRGGCNTILLVELVLRRAIFRAQIPWRILGQIIRAVDYWMHDHVVDDQWGQWAQSIQCCSSGASTSQKSGNNNNNNVIIIITELLYSAISERSRRCCLLLLRCRQEIVTIISPHLVVAWPSAHTICTQIVISPITAPRCARVNEGAA